MWFGILSFPSMNLSQNCFFLLSYFFIFQTCFVKKIHQNYPSEKLILRCKRVLNIGLVTHFR